LGGAIKTLEIQVLMCSEKQKLKRRAKAVTKPTNGKTIFS
jgi:hypothetical protein